MLQGLIPSVGTVGDALDSALCETTSGLYKTECVREGSPFRTGPIRTLADVEDITSAWVGCYNSSRLMHRLGRTARRSRSQVTTLGYTPESTPVTRNEVCKKPGMLQKDVKHRTDLDSMTSRFQVLGVDP